MAIARNETFAEGETILQEKEDGPGLYIIQRGEVTVLKKLPRGGEEILARLAPGEFFGEVSLVTDLPTTARALASEETVCLFLPKEPFVALMEAMPSLEAKVMRRFVRTLARRLFEADELLVTFQLWGRSQE